MASKTVGINFVDKNKKYFKIAILSFDVSVVIFLLKYHYQLQMSSPDNTMHLLQVEEPQEKYICYYAYRRVMLNICLGATFVGYSYTYFNSINFQQFAAEFGIVKDHTFYKGFLSFLIPIGAALGAIACHPVLEHFSRKNSFVFIGAISIIATLVLQIRWVWALIFGRLVQGMAAGIYYILLSLYVKQFPPVELVGRFGPLIQLAFILGMVFSYAETFLFSMFLEVSSYWRIIYIMPVFFLAIQIYNIQTKFPYETPKYLIQNGRKEEARQLLRQFLKPKYVEERMKQLEHYCQMLNHFNFVQGYEPDLDNLSELQHQQKENPELAQKSQHNPLPIIAAYHLSILQQMTAIQVIYIYVGEIVYQVYPSLDKFLPILIHGEGIFAIYLTIYVTGFIGRKAILQFGTIGCAVCLLIISACFYSKERDTSHTKDHGFANFLIVFALFAFRAVFSFTFAPIHPTYLAQIVEPKHVANGSLLMFVFASLISFAFPLMVQWLGGSYPVFLVFGVYSFLSFFVNEWLLVETKDKTEVMIHKEYLAKLEAWSKSK